METKFQQKVSGGEASLQAILLKVEEILRNMAQAYRDSAREMANTDDEHARNLNRSV